MKLTKIRATGLKGLDFETELAPVTFISGPNYVGKSARTDAIRLLLLGYLPELGKTLRATFEIASGRELHVDGVTDTGLVIGRKWWVQKDSVKSDAALPPSIFPEAEGNPVLGVMLDASLYFALSDRERVEYVFKNLPTPTDGISPLVEFPELLIEASAPKEEGDPDLRDAAKIILARMEAAAEPPKPGEEPPTMQAVLDWMLDFVAEDCRTSRESAVRFEKTVQGLAAIRAAEENPDDPKRVDAQITELDKELDALTREEASAAAKVDAIKEGRRRRENLTRDLHAEGALKDSIERLQNEIDQETHELGNIPAITAEELAKATEEEGAIASRIPSQELEIENLRRSLDKSELERQGIEAATACPYCGACGDGWKDKKRTEISGAMAGMQEKLLHLGTGLAGARNAKIAARANRENLQRSKLAREERVKALDKKKGDLAVLEAKVGAFEAKRQELAGLPADDTAVITDREMLATKLRVKKDERNALQTRWRAASGRANDLKRLAEAEKNRDDAKAEEKAGKIAADLLRETKAKAVEAAFAPLLESANSLLGHLLPTPLAYREGEIGTWRKGGWVGHKTFSGTEKLLAYASIQAALAAASPLRILLLDELGRLDSGNFDKVVDALVAAVKSGQIDQCVAIGAVGKIAPNADPSILSAVYVS